MKRHSLLTCLLFIAYAAWSDTTWRRHVIDNTSNGADGVRLADVNGDGMIDVATGWEEGGVIRVYINPGYENVKEPWHFVTVGKAASPEDAVFVDLDNDGNTDVVSCCEGNTKSVFIHWSPSDKSDFFNESQWKTEAVPVLHGKQSWMYCLPMQVDGTNGIDLVLGSKGDNATVGWLEAPEDPRDLSAWKWHPVYNAGWIMSLIGQDMDGDGDTDILLSDRKKENRGCKWLENPGDYARQVQSWTEHVIGGVDREVMFIDYADLDRDGAKDVLAAVYNKELLFLRAVDSSSLRWEPSVIEIPESAGIGKAVVVGDIDLDGKLDLVFTSEKAGIAGVQWLSYRESPIENQWQSRDISGAAGIKFDRIELLDLDGDGDLDLMTCEERDNLGVIWYENPTK